MRDRDRFFYGWAVAGAASATLFLGFGVAYSFAAFFHALRDEFDASRGDVSLVFAITGFLYFVLGVVSGPLADRAGPKRVVLAGILLIAAGLATAAAANALWQVYLTYSLGVGIGVGFIYVPVVGTVQRWFVRKRGFASGIAVSGIGLGTLVGPLAAALLVDGAGWREAYLALAATTLAVGIPAALLIEHSPQRRGLLPDGERRAAGVPLTASPASFDTRGALVSRPFWLMYAACVATSVGIFVPFAHLAPYAEDQGLSSATGAVLVGLIGVGSTAGRLLLGGTADRVGRRNALGGTFAVMAAVLLGWLGATEAWSLAVFALIFGAGYGGFVALLPALAADYFGGRNAGAIIGVLYTSAGFGALVGPVLAGLIYDARESYTLPILLGVALNLVAVACIAAAPGPDRWRTGRVEPTPAPPSSRASKPT